MFACVLAASMAQAQAPAAPQGGQKIPLNEGLRRAYNTIKMNLTEAAQKFGEADYSYRPSPDIRVYGGAAGARRQLAVQRVRGGARREEPASGDQPRTNEDVESRHHSGARRLVCVLRSGVRESHRSERGRARAPGDERGRARRRALEPHRAQQRGIRHPDGLPPHQGHRPALNGARDAGTRCGRCRRPRRASAVRQMVPGSGLRQVPRSESSAEPERHSIAAPYATSHL